MMLVAMLVLLLVVLVLLFILGAMATLNMMLNITTTSAIMVMSARLIECRGEITMALATAAAHRTSAKTPA